MFGLQVFQTALQSRNHGLRTVIDPQTQQDHAHMALYRGLGDPQRVGNFFVAISPHHQGKNFAFARAKI